MSQVSTKFTQRNGAVTADARIRLSLIDVKTEIFNMTIPGTTIADVDDNAIPTEVMLMMRISLRNVDDRRTNPNETLAVVEKTYRLTIAATKKWYDKTIRKLTENVKRNIE